MGPCALFGLLLSFGMLFPNRIIVPLPPPIPMGRHVAIFGGIELLLGLERAAASPTSRTRLNLGRGC